jgi:hypothetical protein
MRKILTYFLLGGVSGYIWEHYVLGKTKVSDTLLSRLGMKDAPFLTIYGIGYVVMHVLGKTLDLLISTEVSNVERIIIKSLVATLVLTSVECIIGKISYKFNKDRMTWDYGDEEDCNTGCIVGCDGYTSPEATLMWALAAVTFYSLEW